ncbi:hypothetical protein DUI87_16496 [Hirundo rustica rustica]|uniref:Uncharacterized protein n=1 Tax=Hirundo rustica rustica TaxID=333673 RepID=A0A3M0K1K4_HIRRU|nr:hypothetical protein DUI87_16496 [Hirundo rustica rustica]
MPSDNGPAIKSREKRRLAWDTVGLLGHQGHTAGSWTACGPPGSQGPFLQRCFPADQPPAYAGAWSYSSSEQDPAFAFVELQAVLLCPSLQPVEVLLKGCTALWDIGHSSQLYVIRKIAEETSAPSPKSLMNKFNNSGPSIEHWGTPVLTGIQLNTCAIDYNPLGSAVHQFSIHSLFTHPVLPEFAYKDVGKDAVRHSDEKFSEVGVDNTHFSSLIHPGSFSVVEGNQFYIMQIAGDDVKLTESPKVMNLGHSYETEIRIADDQRK